MSYQEALDDSEARDGGRSVLVGNGLSIDWDHGKFHYESLYEEADLTQLTVQKESLFETLESKDFEQVIENLKSAATLAELYGADETLIERMLGDARTVKHGLSNVIAKVHPHTRVDVTDVQAENARAFFSSFGRIFTLNYDLLLYWVLLRDEASVHQVQKGDGFEWPAYDDRSRLIWKYKAAERGQRVYYLHGAIHLFVGKDRRLEKVGFSNNSIVDRIRNKIECGTYPLVVTEGTYEEKASRIERSAYLRYCHRKLQEATGSLFIHGASLSPNDEHICAYIEAKDSQVDAIYVGVFGQPDSDDNEKVISRAESMKRRRTNNSGRQLEVFFYDSETARVWQGIGNT